MYSIVTNSKIISEIKKSRYFKTNLGIVNTIEKNGDRVYNDRDKFSFFYNNTYKTTIQGQGHVGNIMFYIDYYIKTDVLAVYYNTEEFIFEYDEKLMKNKGADFYIGHIFKTLELEHEERLKKAEEQKFEYKKESDPTILNKNPGSVRYEDLQAYLAKKRQERYLIESKPKEE